MERERWSKSSRSGEGCMKWVVRGESEGGEWVRMERDVEEGGAVEQVE